MAFEQRDNSGALFRNNAKTKETHPDYQGDCMVNGHKMRMSAWLKESAKGKFMSLSFSEPYNPNAEQTDAPQNMPPKVETAFDDLEEVPF